jgi:predicted dehydrogenase
MKQNIWLFGLGYWGNILLPRINQIFQNDIFVIDPRFDKDLESKFLFQIKTIGDFERQAKSSDIVFVLTPPDTHFDMVRIALNKHCHIWVEKPLCLNARDAQKLVSQAKSQGTTLFIDNTFLFDDSIHYLKNILAFSDIKVNANFSRTAWGKLLKKYGVIWDLLPHDLSIISFLFGKIKDVNIIDFIYDSDLKAVIEIWLKLETTKGDTIIVHSSCASSKRSRSIEIFKGNQVFFQQSIKGRSVIEVSNILNLANSELNQVVQNLEFIQEPIIIALKNFKELLVSGDQHFSLQSSVEEISIMEKISKKISLLS